MHYTPHYANLTDEGSPFARCLAMIERHAPRLMVVGGGALIQEVPGSGRRISSECRQSIMAALRASGGTEFVPIAKANGVARSTVCKIWQKMQREGTA